MVRLNAWRTGSACGPWAGRASSARPDAHPVSACLAPAGPDGAPRRARRARATSPMRTASDWPVRPPPWTRTVTSNVGLHAGDLERLLHPDLVGRAREVVGHRATVHLPLPRARDVRSTRATERLRRPTVWIWFFTCCHLAAVIRPTARAAGPDGGARHPRTLSASSAWRDPARSWGACPLTASSMTRSGWVSIMRLNGMCFSPPM